MAEIDGSRIATWTDLARALEEVYGAMRWPEDPERKVGALLERARQQGPRNTALLWRHAAHCLQKNPRLLPGLAADYTCKLALFPAVQTRSLLLFLALPESLPEPSVEHREPIQGAAGREVVEPAPAAFCDDDRDAEWYQPRRGELTP